MDSNTQKVFTDTQSATFKANAAIHGLIRNRDAIVKQCEKYREYLDNNPKYKGYIKAKYEGVSKILEGIDIILKVHNP